MKLFLDFELCEECNSFIANLTLRIHCC